MMTDVREAVAADAAAIAQLLGQLDYPAMADEVVARLDAIAASPRHAVFVALDEQGLHGLIAIERQLGLAFGERSEIVALVVDADRRRSGAGQRLVEAASAWARERGDDLLVVRSNVARSESHPFYQGLGFERTKTQHVYKLQLE